MGQVTDRAMVSWWLAEYEAAWRGPGTEGPAGASPPPAPPRPPPTTQRAAICRTRAAALFPGVPAAVTSNGRAERPRTTGTACVAVRWWLGRGRGQRVHRAWLGGQAGRLERGQQPARDCCR